MRTKSFGYILNRHKKRRNMGFKTISILSWIFQIFFHFNSFLFTELLLFWCLFSLHQYMYEKKEWERETKVSWWRMKDEWTTWEFNMRPHLERLKRPPKKIEKNFFLSCYSSFCCRRFLSLSLSSSSLSSVFW